MLLLDNLCAVTGMFRQWTTDTFRNVFFCGILITYMIIFVALDEVQVFHLQTIVNFNIPEFYCPFSVLVDTVQGKMVRVHGLNE